MDFYVDTSDLHLFLSGWTPSVHYFEGQWWLFSQKLLNLTQIIILLLDYIFTSGLKTDFQPASIQRPTLHLDPWVTDLSMHLPRIPRHVKWSKYHTLIDSESYFLPPRSLRVLMLGLTKWGLQEQRAMSLCMEDLLPPQTPRALGVKTLTLQDRAPPHEAPWASSGYRSRLLKGSWYFRFDKNRETF